jgi:hypothetical protein
VSSSLIIHQRKLSNSSKISGQPWLPSCSTGWGKKLREADLVFLRGARSCNLAFGGFVDAAGSMGAEAAHARMAAHRHSFSFRSRRPLSPFPRSLLFCGHAAPLGPLAGPLRLAPFFISLVTGLNPNCSKNLNKTWPNFEYVSCRSSYPLSFSKRLYRVFLNRICKK